MLLQGGGPAGHIDLVSVLNKADEMRVSHIDGGWARKGTRRKFKVESIRRGCERNPVPIPPWRIKPQRELIAVETGPFDQATCRLQHQPVHGAVLQQKPSDATARVQARLRFGAVDIVNAQPCMRPAHRGMFDDQKLIAPNAEMPIADPADLFWAWRIGPLTAIDHDKVVAQPMHLQEGSPGGMEN